MKKIFELVICISSWFFAGYSFLQFICLHQTLSQYFLENHSDMTVSGKHKIIYNN